MFRTIAAGITAICGTKRKDLGRGLIGAVACLMLLIAATGCAPALYSVNMRYEATKAAPPVATDGRKYSVTVAPFVDGRTMEDTLLIGRVVKSGGEAIPIMPRYVKPPDAVAGALRELLFKSGYLVSPDRPAWGLTEAEIRPEWGTILVGGSIDELDVTCLDSLTMKRYSAKARLTLVFADVRNRRIFYRVTSESSSSLDHILFSEEKLEEQISGVLSDALEKAIEGPETARQIREALSR
ncbi:MAG: hypothetical protein ACYC7J_11850 [Syntrophales bacterium]